MARETLWTLTVSVGASSAEEALTNVKAALDAFTADDLTSNLLLVDERVGVDDIDAIKSGAYR